MIVAAASSAVISAVWARLVPFVCPILKLLVPWLAPVWSLVADLRSVVAPGLMLLVGGIAIYWSLTTVMNRPAPPRVVSTDAVEANRLAAENKALREAYGKQSRILAESNAERAIEDEEREKLTRELEMVREKSKSTTSTDSGRAVVRSDDPWMRAKTERAARASGTRGR